jgi:hypothetical protein
MMIRKAGLKSWKSRNPVIVFKTKKQKRSKTENPESYTYPEAALSHTITGRKTKLGQLPPCFPKLKERMKGRAGYLKQALKLKFNNYVRNY